MGRAWLGLLPVGGAVALAGLLSLSGPSFDPAVNPPVGRRCGVGLGLFASTPDYDYAPLLAEIVAHGATDVLLSVPWVQLDRTSSHLAPQPGQSPSGSTLVQTLTQAHELGLTVSLMPVVRLERRSQGEWRGALEPRDPEAWFAAYGGLLLEHAALAEQHGAARLVVGSELSSLEGQSERWRALIGEVRERFSGTLTWSANWDRFEQVAFWDALDEVGVSAWFELGADPERGWDEPIRRLRTIAETTGKPVVLTEVGYPARATAALRPWDHSGPATVDVALQATLFALFFRRFHHETPVRSVFVWNWFGHGGRADAGYSPRGRPAAREVKRAYSGWCGAHAEAGR